MTYNLLSTTAKLEKSEGKSRYVIRGLSLAPADSSGKNVCQYNTIWCRPPACVALSGNGRYPAVMAGRIRRTVMFFEERDKFASLISKDIEKFIKKSAEDNVIPCVRLNVFSDIPWERTALKINGEKTTLIEAYGDKVIFYDYTKYPFGKRQPTGKYHLTYSASGTNTKECREALYEGQTVAAVFDIKKGEPLPDTWYGHPVINGDKDDLRFLDPAGHVVGLYAKGGLRGKSNPFVFTGKEV